MLLQRMLVVLQFSFLLCSLSLLPQPDKLRILHGEILQEKHRLRTSSRHETMRQATFLCTFCLWLLGQLRTLRTS